MWGLFDHKRYPLLSDFHLFWPPNIFCTISFCCSFVCRCAHLRSNVLMLLPWIHNRECQCSFRSACLCVIAALDWITERTTFSSCPRAIREWDTCFSLTYKLLCKLCRLSNSLTCSNRPVSSKHLPSHFTKLNCLYQAWKQQVSGAYVPLRSTLQVKIGQFSILVFQVRSFELFVMTTFVVGFRLLWLRIMVWIQHFYPANMLRLGSEDEHDSRELFSPSHSLTLFQTSCRLSLNVLTKLVYYGALEVTWMFFFYHFIFYVALELLNEVNVVELTQQWCGFWIEEVYSAESLDRIRNVLCFCQNTGKNFMLVVSQNEPEN